MWYQNQMMPHQSQNEERWQSNGHESFLILQEGATDVENWSVCWEVERGTVPIWLICLHTVSSLSIPSSEWCKNIQTQWSFLVKLCDLVLENKKGTRWSWVKQHLFPVLWSELEFILQSCFHRACRTLALIQIRLKPPQKLRADKRKLFGMTLF